MVHYHPTDEMLLAYATGAQNAATSLLVACHLTFCPKCRERAAFFDAIGGVLLQEAVPVSPLAGRTALPPLPESGPGPADTADSDTGGSDDLVLPRPLRLRTRCAAADLPWRRVIPGLFEAPVEVDDSTATAKLMRIEPGRSVPRHTHEGAEATLVLTGAFSDAAGHYERGDVALANGTVDHKPIADPGEACICLAVTDAPLKFTGTLGRITSLLRKT